MTSTDAHDDARMNKAWPKLMTWHQGLLFTGWLLMLIGTLLPFIYVPLPDLQSGPLLFLLLPIPDISADVTAEVSGNIALHGYMIVHTLLKGLFQVSSWEQGLILSLVITPLLLAYLSPGVLLISNRLIQGLLALFYILVALIIGIPAVLALLNAPEEVGLGMINWTLAYFFLGLSRIAYIRQRPTP